MSQARLVAVNRAELFPKVKIALNHLRVKREIVVDVVQRISRVTDKMKRVAENLRPVRWYNPFSWYTKDRQIGEAIDQLIIDYIRPYTEVVRKADEEISDATQLLEDVVEQMTVLELLVIPQKAEVTMRAMLKFDADELKAVIEKMNITLNSIEETMDKILAELTMKAS